LARHSAAPFWSLRLPNKSQLKSPPHSHSSQHLPKRVGVGRNAVHIEHCLVGFNSKGFDDKLLAANGLEGIETHYDLLEEIRIAAGFDAHFSSVPKGYSYKLDALAKANGSAKTGSGELAPVLWQQGKKQEVIDYCKMDVEITSKILNLGLAGELIDPNTGDKLKLRNLETVVSELRSNRGLENATI
jgi:hypothetical protein